MATNGDPLVDNTTGEITFSGQTAIYSGSSSNGITNWGSLVANNTTEVTIQGVGNDSVNLMVAPTLPIRGEAYKVFDEDGVFIEYRDKITDAVVDPSDITTCPDQVVGIDSSSKTEMAGLNAAAITAANQLTPFKVVGDKYVGDFCYEIAQAPTILDLSGDTPVDSGDTVVYTDAVSYTHLTLPTIYPV